MKKKTSPSAGWRNQVFNSLERLDAEKCATTTRVPVSCSRVNRIVVVSGFLEGTAMCLLEHLYFEKRVKRWKSQPFNLLELGGPDAVPDALAELDDDELHVIQVKAHRFLTPDIQEKYRREREFLEPREFRYHIWTDHDVLCSATKHTIAELERGRRESASPEKIAQIREAAQKATRLVDLLNVFGWDDVLSAAAHLSFFFDITKALHENTPIFRNHSFSYAGLFGGRDAAREWWEALAPAQV